MKEVLVAESIINTYTEDEVLSYIAGRLHSLRGAKIPADATIDFMYGVTKSELRMVSQILDALLDKKSSIRDSKDPKIML